MPMIARAWESMIMLGFTSETFSCIKPEMMTETATQVEEKEELGAEQIGNKLHFRIQPVQSIMLGWLPKGCCRRCFSFVPLVSREAIIVLPAPLQS